MKLTEKVKEFNELFNIYVHYIYRRFLSKKFRNPNLKKYKNIHKGRRCFIVATGPSLTLEDVATLAKNNEITFGINSCVKFFDKTSWRPTYYFVTDPCVYQSLIDEYFRFELPVVFYINIIKNQIFKTQQLESIVLEPKSYDYTQTKYFDRTGKILKLFKQQVSSDVSRIMHNGNTVVFAVLQLAIYMGFSEIYLLGTDCNFTSEQKYSKIANYSSGVPTKGKGTEDVLISGYEQFKKYTDKTKRCTIYNATRGGKLEVFERVDFDKLFS